MTNQEVAKYILDNYTLLKSLCVISPDQSNESVWKAIEYPSPWMFNKCVVTDILC